MKFKLIGEYKLHGVCRFCNSEKLVKILNLGIMPLAGGFLNSKKEFAKEKFYPLELYFCTTCFLVQTTAVIDENILFKKYFYFSSKIKTLVDHFEKAAEEFTQYLTNSNSPFVVEIGSNDGSFVHAGLDNGWKIIGVDPASNIVGPLIKKGFPIMNAFFTEKLAHSIIKKHGKADMIFSSNTLAHIEDMHNVIRGILYLLKDEGIFVFEVHYLGNLVKQFQYDMIYHEHQYYYSLHAIRNLVASYNMEIFDIAHIPIHAGSVRFYVQHKKSKREVRKKVFEELQKEVEWGLTEVKSLKMFKSNIEQKKKNLLYLLHELKKNKKKIAGYGASGRGTIIMNYCNIDHRLLDYVIDDSPVKQGLYTPGNHLKIVSSEILKTKQRPDYILVFAWSFIEEIKKRNREFIRNDGKFILPLPEVKVI